MTTMAQIMKTSVGEPEEGGMDGDCVGEAGNALAPGMNGGMSSGSGKLRISAARALLTSSVSLVSSYE